MTDNSRNRVGQSMPMLDAEERVIGTVKFTLDHMVPDMAHARILRSPYPHARILEIDTSLALQRPGVICVLTGEDFSPDSGINPWYGQRRKDQPIVAIGKVRYVGDPVAVIVAETEEIASEALFDVVVEYEELPFVVDATDAAKAQAPTIHDEWPDNECGAWHLEHGDIESAWQDADHVFEGVFTSPSANHVPMEPHVSIAQWSDDDGSAEVWTSTQSPHGVHGALVEILNTQPEKVRVHTFNLGGGYGAKGGVKLEPMAVCAARKAGRPVRIALTREEVFQTIAKHAATIRIKTGVKSDGTFVAREVDVLWNAGAYAVSSPRATQQGMVRAPGPYRTPNVRVTSHAYYTNTVPTGPFRGAMTSQVCWAYEQQTDEIASNLGIDPIELRRKNLLRDGDTYATGEVFPHVHYLDLLSEVAQAIDWTPEDAAVQWDGRSRVARGKGVALLIKHTATPSRSEARVQLNSDGACQVFSSSVEMGQGARTTLLQFVSDELGIPLENIQAIQPDTAYTPFDTTTSSSRTAYSMSFALREASNDLKEQLAKVAAPLLEASAADVEVRDGGVRVTGSPEAGLSYAEVLSEAQLSGLAGEGVFQSPEGYGVLDDKGQGIASVHWHEGAVGLEIEVDTTTGKVSIVNCHAASYAGRILNPVMVRQQNEGNVIMGIGPSLFEEYVYDSGQLVNPNLSDYMIPSFLDLPAKLTSRSLESNKPDAEIHGVGEMTLPVVGPALGNALYHATGVRVYDLPLTAERVFRALHADDLEEVS